MLQEKGQVVNPDSSVVIEVDDTGCRMLADAYLAQLLVQKDHVTFIDPAIAIEIAWRAGGAEISDTHDVIESR